MSKWRRLKAGPLPTSEEVQAAALQYGISAELADDALTFYRQNRAVWEGVKDGVEEALDFLKVAAKGLWETVGKDALVSIAKNAWEKARD